MKNLDANKCLLCYLALDNSPKDRYDNIEAALIGNDSGKSLSHYPRDL